MRRKYTCKKRPMIRQRVMKIKVYLNDKKNNKLLKEVARNGKSKSELIREKIINAKIKPKLSEEVMDEMKNITKFGDEINDMAHRVNLGLPIDESRFKEIMYSIKISLEKLEKMIHEK